MNDTRRYYYGKIHESARDLDLPDDAYRSVLYALTGKRSCTDLTEDELHRVNLFLGSELARRHVAEARATKRPHVSDREAMEVLGLL